MNKIVEFRLFNNSWYNPGPKFKIILWYFINVLFFLNPLNPFSGLKVLILRFFGAKIGKKVLIKPNVNIKYPWKLIVGDYSMIGEKVWIDNLDFVVIGNNVCVSQGALILSGNHNYNKVSFDLMIGKITLEDGVWICANSVVCSGVLCRSHAVLSVNSVATSNLDPYSIYSGTPAVKIRERIFK